MENATFFIYRTLIREVSVQVARFLTQNIRDRDLLSLLHPGIKLMVDGIYRRLKNRANWFALGGKPLEHNIWRQPCKTISSLVNGFVNYVFLFGKTNFVHLFPGLRWTLHLHGRPLCCSTVVASSWQAGSVASIRVSPPPLLRIF